MGVWDYDSLTIVLAATSFFLYALRTYLQPVAIAHPLLLGRQSDVGKVRQPGETAIYRNYGVGHGAALPTRPRREVKTAHDVIDAEQTHERTLWRIKITNQQLKLRIQAVSVGLLSRLGLKSKASSALILLDDSFEWLLIDLALSTASIPTTTITKLSLLSATLSTLAEPPSVIFTHASFLSHLLEQVAEDDTKTSIVVIGDESGKHTTAGRKAGFEVVTLEELESAGKGAAGTSGLESPEPSDLFTTTYYDQTRKGVVGTKLTHQNLTAGPTSIRQIFTLSSPLSATSSVVSTFPLSTPFGRAVAYTALLEGSSFATVESTGLLKDVAGSDNTIAQNLDELVRVTSVPGFPRPTHLFLTPNHLTSLTNTIISHAASSFFGGWAWSRKLVELAAGALSDTTTWDFLGGLSSGRREAFGWGKNEPWIKTVVVAGGPFPELTLPTARLALSVPIVNAYVSPISTGPIFASHPFDLQHFPPRPEVQEEDLIVDEEFAHVGPPGGNVEVKIVSLKGQDEDVSAQDGKDPVGKLLYRGPSIGESVPTSLATKDGWIDDGLLGRAHSNGTFRVKEAL